MATIQLQGIGRVNAIPASDLTPGMLLSWNYFPLCYEVVKIEECSDQYLILTERCRKTGHTFSRRMKKDRLVAASAAK